MSGTKASFHICTRELRFHIFSFEFLKEAVEITWERSEHAASTDRKPWEIDNGMGSPLAEGARWKRGRAGTAGNSLEKALLGKGMQRGPTGNRGNGLGESSVGRERH